MSNPEQRFSDRADFYEKYRPSYPAELIDWLRGEQGLSITDVVADMGAGTGLFTALLAPHCGKIWGIEPNMEMLNKARRSLKDFRNFMPFPAKAEATGLPEGFFDWIVAAQTFHWLDAQKAKDEFCRLLKPNGKVALVWNIRSAETPFMRQYEALLVKYSNDYEAIHERFARPNELAAFFSPNRYEEKYFDNAQILDREGLVGRLLSCSYIPQTPGQRFDEMIQETQKIFDRFEQNGTVAMTYKTYVALGRLNSR